MRLTNLEMEMEGLLFVPIYQKKSDIWGDVRFLRLDKLNIKSASLNGGSLKAFLEGRVKGLVLSSFELDQTVRLRGAYRNLMVSAEACARVTHAPPGLTLELKSARLGATPLPAFLVRPFQSFTQPFSPTPELPFAISAPGLTIADGRISVP
jgi:hypothetical protein